MNESLRDRVVLLLTNGMSVEAAEGYCINQGGLDVAAARLLVAEARKRITVAADFARDEQLGKAVMRLDDLYAKSIAARDNRTALQAQRELNRLMGLYADGEPEGDVVAEEEVARRLDLVASYLLPLNLIEAKYPVEEHARVAAEILRSSGHARSV